MSPEGYRVRSKEDVLAVAESRVIYRLHYNGAERGSSTMESLQQATDGDGQTRNTQRYQERNITLRRYIEDKRGWGGAGTKRLVRGSLFVIIVSTVCCVTCIRQIL